MLSVLKIIIGLSFGFLFSGLAFVLFERSHLILGFVFLLFAGISLFVWGAKKNLTYRFLYPGMLAFALFTILPIIFSVFISFTNLGTGHFFSQEKVKSILLNEKVITNSGESLPFLLFEGPKDDLALQVFFEGKHYQAIISPTKKELKKLTFVPLDGINDATPLRPDEVYHLRNQLKKFVFEMPDGRNYLYHRIDKLIEGHFLFKETNDGGLLNIKSGKKFLADVESGFYVSAGSPDSVENLEPGFYTFVGLKNFTDLFRKKEFRKTFLKVSVWTFIWALLSVILTFSLGLSLALFINDKNLRFKAIYRNLLILPYSIPFFISVLVFKGMLNKDFGVINNFLQSFGLSAIPWLEDGLWAKVSCLLVNLWLGFPYMFLLTTGILQSIPESVYEAAKIDGANKWQSFKSITLPLILNSITPLLIGAFAFNLGNFVGIYLLTGGGPAMADAITPAGQTDILISYTYRLAFEGAMGQQFGLASSIALFIFVIIGALTAVNFMVFNKEEGR